jgi:hypothetical protein
MPAKDCCPKFGDKAANKFSLFAGSLPSHVALVKQLGTGPNNRSIIFHNERMNRFMA